ncbi:MAG: helix-turn-helix transcriptional regulator [Steroidobacteraceae bacterium]|jgi:DNA-binding CsgD family transcriptional regulator/PAS domain-containing protein|nr:helix-turn-helix transcriptional regulator [Steroidobacteraceae bacterium]
MATAGDLEHRSEPTRQTGRQNLAELLSALQMPLERFSDLLELIYRGPLETIPCSSAMMQLRGDLRANEVVLILRPPGANAMGLIMRDGARGAELCNYVYTQFPIFSLDPFIGLPPDRAVRLDEIVDPEKWVKGEFFKQYVAPRRVRYVLGADIHGDEGREFRLRFTRPPEADDFSPSDKALVQALIPHFKRALNLHTRLGQIETEMQLYADAMSSMLVGSIILDGAGTVLRANSVAQAILAERDGLSLSQNTLSVRYRTEDRELQRLIRQTLETPPGQPAIAEALSISRPSGRAALSLLIRPMPLSECSDGPNRPSVAIFIRDPERSLHPSLELVQRLFHFTPAEAKLALLLTNGLSLDEAAEEMAVRKSTARAHLRAIFSKAGVKRQITLVRLLLNSVASIS